MELKQIVMLGLLLGVAVIGSAVVIYVLSHLDKNEEEKEKADAENRGQQGH